MITHTHDIFCDCYDPITHTAALIFEQEPDLKFSPPEKDIIKKCLTGDDTTAATKEENPDGIGEGDLDALFTEDFGEENLTG